MFAAQRRRQEGLGATSRTLLAGVAVGAALLLPPGASAAVTVGEDTSVASTDSFAGCTPACTVANLQHPTRAVTVPFDGVIVRWRIRTSVATGAFSLRVLRQGAGGAFTGAGTSTPETIVPGAERTLLTRLPVLKGDFLGLQHPDSAQTPAAVEIRPMVPGAQWAAWYPALGEGENPGRPQNETFDNQAFLFNADVEPDCDRDGFGDETHDQDSSTCIPRQCAGKAATIVGSSHLGDTIVGTPKNDVIASVDGNDKVLGKGGNDTICGGTGRDRLVGGPGRDRLIGQAGRDSLIGQAGKDSLIGQAGKDNLRGGGGKDNLRGGGGKDTCAGGGGGDRDSGCEKATSTL